MKKRLAGLLLSGIMLCTCLTGCGNTAASQVVQEEVQPQIIHIYTYDDQLEKSLGYVWEKHPDWSQRVELIKVDSEQYISLIEEKLDSKDEEKCPDIFVADAGNMADFINNENIMSVSELGFGDSELGQMYEYTVEAVRAEESVKAVTWMITPGAFIYRKSFAEELLGSSDVKEVQSYVKDWNTFCDTAVALSRKSDGRVKMLASVHDIDRVVACNRADVWMKDDIPVINDAYNQMLEVQLYLKKQGYALDKQARTADYLKSAAGDQVFGFFATSDFIKNELSDNCGGTAVGTGSFGDWGVCAGPQSYVDGGQWIFTSKKCSDTELAGNILRALCLDQNTLMKINENEGIFVNNQKVISNAYNAGKGKLDILGGDDYIKAYDKQAKNAGVYFIDSKTGVLDELFFELSDNYIDGKMKKEDFCKLFYQEADKMLNPPPTPEVIEEAVE